MQSQQPAGLTSKCMNLIMWHFGIVNKSIGHCNNIYGSEKMEKRNTSPLKIFIKSIIMFYAIYDQFLYSGDLMCLGSMISFLYNNFIVSACSCRVCLPQAVGYSDCQSCMFSFSHCQERMQHVIQSCLINVSPIVCCLVSSCDAVLIYCQFKSIF